MVEISPEVETWYASLKSKDKAMADRVFEWPASPTPLAPLCAWPPPASPASTSAEPPDQIPAARLRPCMSQHIPRFGRQPTAL